MTVARSGVRVAAPVPHEAGERKVTIALALWGRAGYQRLVRDLICPPGGGWSEGDFGRRPGGKNADAVSARSGVLLFC
jgi:hypothetical protein